MHGAGLGIPDITASYGHPKGSKQPSVGNIDGL